MLFSSRRRRTRHVGERYFFVALPPLVIRNFTCKAPIVQGGMGIGVSMAPLARAVSREGGLGTLSSASIDLLVSRRIGKKVKVREASALEVQEAKSEGGPIAINIMVALQNSFENSVLGSLDGGVDAIVCGAGLPLKLPSIVKNHSRAEDVALIPIVSSGRALRLICKRWAANGRPPDAAVLEGPMAGGHLGWKTKEAVFDPTFSLENILHEVLEVSREFGNFPIIAAGGIYTHEDIARIINAGASGVQLGTRFLATAESGASNDYKSAVVKCGEKDIEVAVCPGSPCGLPFRVLKTSPMYEETIAGSRPARCDKGYILSEGKCAAKTSPNDFFCICNGLLSSSGYNSDEEPPLYTVGSNAYRVDRVMTVAELMTELKGNN